MSTLHPLPSPPCLESWENGLSGEGAQSSVAAVRDAQCWLTADCGRGVSSCEQVGLLSLSRSQEGKDGGAPVSEVVSRLPWPHCLWTIGEAEHPSKEDVQIHSCSPHRPRVERKGTRHILQCARNSHLSTLPQLLSFPPSPSVTKAWLSRQISPPGQNLQCPVLCQGASV